jgi:competence protein ComEC
MKGRFEPNGWGLAVAWLAGIALQLQQAALWPAWVYAALLAGGLLLLALRARGRRWMAPALLGAAALAFGATGGRAADRLADTLPDALEGQDLVVTGVVAQMPRSSLAGLRFVFEVEAARHEGRPVRIPPLVSLGWYRGFDEDAWLSGPAHELRAGQRWRLTVRLKQPHGSMNPHGFDLELWLFEQGIRAGGYVRASPGAVTEKLADDVAHPFERARQHVRDALYAHVSDATSAGVLAALAIGDQAAIERDDWDLFRATGVAHLMSISGLHVTMFAWLAGAALGALWRRSARLMLWLPAPQAARWGGLAAALAYSLLAGWGVPAQRTVWMIAVVVALRSLGLRWPLGAVLLAAGVVVTAIDPWAMLQPGFWLSFVAVAMLIASEPVSTPFVAPPVGWRARLRATLQGGLRSQLIATVGLAPLSMLFFQQISVVGFAANLVAIPVVTLLITPLALLGTLVPLLWTLAAAIAHALMLYLGALASWPLAVWTAAAAPAWAMAAGLLGGVLLVMPLPRGLRALGLPLLLPLLWPPVERPQPGTFEVVAADIGQGTSVLVRTAGHLMVYDTGPQYAPDADAGQRVLLPLLRARGERQVDRLVLSHQDSDHVGGAASLLAGTVVREIRSSLPEDHRLLQRGVPHERCEAGQAWDWDGVHFEVLHPTAAEHALATKPNAVSCVVRVLGTKRSLLLTGDIEAPQEAALLARGADLHADVLQVPHHGSRTSSSEAFIDAVAPQTAVVQAAYRSRFRHPAPDVVARYVDRGIEVVRSDRCGAWTLPADAERSGPAVCERQSARRYWHHWASPDPP